MDPRIIFAGIAAYLYLKPARQGYLGAFEPKVIKGERDGHWLARRVPEDPHEIQDFRMGFEAGLERRVTPVTMEASSVYRTGYAVGRESRDDPKMIRLVQAVMLARLQAALPPPPRTSRVRSPAPRKPGARMSVREVSRHFANSDKPAKSSGAMHTDGTSIWSYKKLIAQKRMQDPLDNVCYVEKRRFTKTTSKHQNMVRAALDLAGWKLIEVEFP